MSNNHPTSSNIDEIVGCKYRAAHKWLNDLADKGPIKRQTIVNFPILERQWIVVVQHY